MDEPGFGSNVVVEDQQTVPVDLAFLHALALSVIRSEDFPPDTELSVALVADARIAEMNNEYLQKQGPTDVLSFPLHDLEPGVAPSPSIGSPPFTLGDVLIAPAYVARQAAEFEVDFNSEMALMLVHGMLHLMGYDHHGESDAETMEARETVLLATFGVGRR